MSYRIQTRYTGIGPRQGVWLFAFEQAGFTINDKHPTAESAQRELTRLKQFAPQFRRPDSDWEARIVDASGEIVGEPQTTKSKPKKKRKKSKPKPEPVTPDSFGGEDFQSDDKDFLNL
ncbi:MAG: hypothetical protein JSV86_04875 [Gemmatimonadota bacterium]|nr:MAG: hypothetical protein JSV86_04875 [Gemmatimonadota bacterium]